MRNALIQMLRAIPYVAIPLAMVIAAVIFPSFNFTPAQPNDYGAVAAQTVAITNGVLLSAFLLFASISILLFVRPVKRRRNVNSVTQSGQPPLVDKSWRKDQIKLIGKLVIVGILLDAGLFAFLRLALFPFLAGFHD
jgi:hypothetical protein